MPQDVDDRELLPLLDQHLSFLRRGFAGGDGGLRAYREARAVVLPVPYERRTSSETGSYLGPHAIIAASQRLDCCAGERSVEGPEPRIATLPPVRLKPELAASLEAIRDAASGVVGDGKFLVSLGGERVVSLGLVAGVLDRRTELGVLWLDAHLGWCDEVSGDRYHHHCVLRRIGELGPTAAAVGPRWVPHDLADRLSDPRLAVLPAPLSSAGGEPDLRALLETLPDAVYLSMDVDFLDPSLMPATATPEPGGCSWQQALSCLRQVFAGKEVVAMDLVGLAPVEGDSRAASHVAAKLVHECLGYRVFERDENFPSPTLV